jgi:lysozyme
MRTSPKGAAAIAAYEALVPAVYIDRVANPPVATFGIGHTHMAGGLDPRKMPLDNPSVGTRLFDQRVQLAIETFVTDLTKFEDRVKRAISRPLKQHELDALVKFDFNTGAIHKAKLREAINAGASADVIRSRFMAWSRAGTNANILAGRRAAEADMFLLGRYPSKATAVWPTDGKGNVIWRATKHLSADEVARMVEAARGAPPVDYVKPESVTKAPESVTGGWGALVAAIIAVVAFLFRRKK